MSDCHFISKTVKIGGAHDPYWKIPNAERTISASLPLGADERDVTTALREIERLAKLVDVVCPGCFVPWETFHTPDCPYADEDQMEKLREEAIKDGLR